jgi:S-adenosylmethionine:tRNA ribosyltransferase-isomerase
MHSEYYCIENETAMRLAKAKTDNKMITAIGSTALRTLESAEYFDGAFQKPTGKTDLFLYPGADFTFVDHFFTNFHLPKSTLIMLLAAFAAPGKKDGLEEVKRVYQKAIEERYRFFSYGDASLWW